MLTRRLLDEGGKRWLRVEETLGKSCLFRGSGYHSLRLAVVRVWGRARSIDTPALSRSISEGPPKIDRPPEIGWLVGSLLAMQVKTPGK
ncbi:hypothetical protein RE6C_00937 [Rhodopirellula europaea 6C]|uniref:Uncharacterized protein n=1 Tax=Rhodopirellula europaea 6C TaxID=1263867 RepID=M2B807_9BACT|nr:hypothetical protein RE6C_00937 [Rhodopirellula europaea 6C]